MGPGRPAGQEFGLGRAGLCLGRAHGRQAAGAAANGRGVLLGGDTGFFYNNGKSPAEHPGQPKTVYAFRPATGEYSKVGELPVGIVTAPAIECCGKVHLISGETGPGKRTNTVTVVERV